MPDPGPAAVPPERRRGDRRHGDRRKGDRRTGDRRAGDRRRGDPLRAGESWFAAVGVDSRVDPDGESRFADGWHAGDGPDSTFLSRQALRISTGADASAFDRIFGTFLATRAGLGLALLTALILVQVFGERPPVLPLVLALGYALLAIATWWWSRTGSLAAAVPGTARLGRWAWLLTIGVDLAAFSMLHLIEPVSNLNHVALLVLPVLMAGVLTPRVQALGTAAAATLVLLLNGSRSVIAGADVAAALTPAGLAGIGFFVVSLLAGELARRLAREALTARGSLELARQQAQLNRLVIDEMGEGVLVIDRRARVRTANPAARRLLAREGTAPPAPFRLDAMPAWRALAQAVDEAFRHGAWPEAGRDVRLEFSPGVARTVRVRMRFTLRPPGDGPADGTSAAQEDLCVVFVEDVRSVLARTRQEKLAAMGRVSAAIAHEIRNPLAAIAQANALLREDDLAPDQQRLATMVADNVERLRRIVDDVLDAAPGAAAPSQVIDAAAAVDAIVHDWARTGGLPLGADSRVDWRAPERPLPILFDAEPLRRVVSNLLDNARRHASERPGAISLRLDAAGPAQVRLVVASDGEPIRPDVEPHLFEPFFSTRSRGSGLGLYICRELCERFGASIDYRPAPPGDRHPNLFVVTMRTATSPDSA